ncbi:alpha/beta fold hydrolase [Taibaiella koreensis]|uniref:alpha/beta fold hydrolase n=1 Tax=Taibaiella koreensis TaxID=1268548 RepID=UPI000E59AA88|nr:alpha/beta hydrolase [Taibaiella koreensis]
MSVTVSYPYPVQRQKILHDAIEVAYIDEGEGDSIILFVHGLGHSLLGWVRNIEYLKQYHRCIAIDLPGNGLSSTGSYPYSMHFFAEALFDFIQKKKLKHIYLAGHSMGGQICLTFAHLHPEMIKGLILCAPAGFETFNEWEKSLYRNTMYFVDLVSNEENSLRKAIQNSFYIMPDNAPAFTQQLVDLMKLQDRDHYRYMIDRCINAMLDEPVFDYLSAIARPVLILFGERDNLIPNRFIHPISTKKLAETAAERFQQAEVHIISQCGHFLQWEKAQLVNGHIRNFIQ